MSAATFGNLAAVLVENGYRPVPIRKGEKRPVPPNTVGARGTQRRASMRRPGRIDRSGMEQVRHHLQLPGRKRRGLDRLLKAGMSRW